MNAPVHLLLLTFLCWLTLSGPSVAQDTGRSGQAGPATGTDKPLTKKALSEDQMADLRFSHYEVSVSRTTYRPYIVTVSGEKLIQLEYDTMEEAQARIREAKKDNEILSPAWRDKDFGIETIVRKSTDTVFPSSLQKIAKRLATLEKYKPEKERTHCSEFVRDYAKELLGRDVPELRGQASDQSDQLKAAAEDPKSKWWSLGFHDDPSTAFQRAQELADEGKLVVVTWKNPKPTATDSGHVAIVVPRPDNAPELPNSTTWKMGVPYIAQAGAKVFDQDRLSQGFGPTKKSGLEIYVLEP